MCSTAVVATATVPRLPCRLCLTSPVSSRYTDVSARVRHYTRARRPLHKVQPLMRAVADWLQFGGKL